MALVYPLSLATLADRFAVASVVWDIQRNDEVSGTGDARVWQAELAAPLWKADVTLAADYHAPLKQIAALARKLYGAQESFMLYDPLSMYPQSDPTGVVLAGRVVTVKSVGSNRKSISLKGLPPGYTLTLADKVQILYADLERTFFCEVSETVAANDDGETAEFEIFPHVPVGLAADDAVILKRPACKMFIMPGTFRPGTAAGALIDGVTFQAMERRR